MRYSAYSNVGGRSNNEDSLLIEEVNGSCLFVVADGVGGIDAGEVASKAAAEELRNQFLFEEGSFDLRQAIVAANAEVLAMQQQLSKQMKTTISAIYVAGDFIQCAHVGDSRIYLFDDSSILYQSVDHSVSQMAVYAGEITADQIRSHEDRNKLTKALGIDDNLSVDVKTFQREDVKAFLICSDGFWEYVYEQEMLELVRNTDDPELWLTEMRKLLQRRVSKNNDNNTAIVSIL